MLVESNYWINILGMLAYHYYKILNNISFGGEELLDDDLRSRER